MKSIIVGDIHATPNNLDEVRSLFKLIAKTSFDHGTNHVILLGDQSDSHQLQHLSVLHCYEELFKEYGHLSFLLLVGNHDRAVNGNKLHHSMFPYKTLPNVKVVDDFATFEGFDVISYCRTEEEFTSLTLKSKNGILICHQEFDGCQFENGFYSKNGFNIKKLPYQTVISGHIHKTQSWDKIIYPGAPRWMTRSDANEEKNIWVWDGEKELLPVSTKGYCKPIYELSIKEGDELPVLEEHAKYVLDIQGNRKFIKKIFDKYSGKAEIKTTLIENKGTKVKESMGVNLALQDFLKNQYTSQYGISKEVLAKEIFKRLL